MSVRIKKTVLYAVLFIIIGAVIAFAYVNRVKLGRILSPFFIAIILAYIVNPLVKHLESKKVSKMVGILSVYTFFTIILTLSVIFLIPEITGNAEGLVKTLPDITKHYQNIVNGIFGFIQRSGWSDDIKTVIFAQIDRIAAMIQATAEDALNQVIAGIGELILFLVDFSLALVIAYYFIKDNDFFKDLAMTLTPRNYRSIVNKIGREANQVIASFIQGQLFTALIVGILETTGLLLINARYAIILGAFGGLSNVIPYFGPFIGATPAVALAFIDSPWKALETLLIFSLVQQIDNSLISPKVIESRLGLHPVTTILALLIGQQFFGIPGMLVSVPLAAIIKVIVRRIIDALV